MKRTWWILALALSTYAAPIEIETSSPEEQAALESEALSGVAMEIVAENWQDLQFFYANQQRKTPFRGGDMVVKCRVEIGGKCIPSMAYSTLEQKQFEKDVLDRVALWDFTAARALDAKVLFLPMHFNDFVDAASK